MKEKLNLIFIKLFGIKFELGIQRSNVSRWDSLSHVKLMMLLEKEFSINFSIPEAVSILSRDDLLKLLSEKCQN